MDVGLPETRQSATSPERDARRLRSLVLTEWYPSAEDPVLGTFVREKARAIARRHDVVVMHPRPVARPRDGGLFSISDEYDEGLRVLRVGYRRLVPAPLSFLPRLLGTRAALRDLERSGWVPDLIHAHVFPAAFLAVLLARRRGLPVIASENSTAFPRGEVRGWQRAMARLAFGMADLVCPASEDLGRHIARLGVRTRIRPVPNVVDTSLFSPGAGESAGPSGPGGPARILLVALLDPKKGVDHLLRALAAVEPPRFMLRIAGDGPVRRELEALRDQLGLSEHVEFLGLRSKPEVARLMRQSDFLVLPSLWENLPNVLIEAMACGLPVVATRTGGVPEMIDEGAGLLVEPGDVEGLRAALERMLDAHAGYDRKAIARAAGERYGHEAVGARWDELYNEVVGERAAAGQRRRARRRRPREASAR
jgi:glycosyltransferase involved in cell wall biosynthesis